jgi:hypothetical protein
MKSRIAMTATANEWIAIAKIPYIDCLQFWHWWAFVDFAVCVAAGFVRWADRCIRL